MSDSLKPINHNPDGLFAGYRADGAFVIRSYASGQGEIAVPRADIPALLSALVNTEEWDRLVAPRLRASILRGDCLGDAIEASVTGKAPAGLLSAAAIREGLATAPLRSGASVADQVAAMETGPRTAAGRMYAMVDAAKPGDEDEAAEQSLWREIALDTVRHGRSGAEAAANADQVLAGWRKTFGPQEVTPLDDRRALALARKLCAKWRGEAARSVPDGPAAPGPLVERLADELTAALNGEGPSE